MRLVDYVVWRYELWLKYTKKWLEALDKDDPSITL